MGPAGKSITTAFKRAATATRPASACIGDVDQILPRPQDLESDAFGNPTKERGFVMNTNTLRRISIAAAIFCASLSIVVFALLLLVQHDSLAEAAKGATPLAVFALFGAFGAVMTRYLAR